MRKLQIAPGVGAFLTTCGLSVALGAQSPTVPRSSGIAPFNAPWITVFRDSAFQIALDTSRVERVDATSYLLWMQTRWVTARRGSTRRTASPFNRELIHTFLRCESVAYKVARTVVSLDDGPPIDSIGAGVDAARQSDWRKSSEGSADVGAGVEACAILSRRASSRGAALLLLRDLVLVWRGTL